ncbi:hypothetical protein BH11BAC3_BH11BAC3_00310 [soil metagenome]
MKRFTAILLLGVFAFNLFGYRLIASFLENQENEKMERAFDINDYSDNQLISIKQPANLPYYTSSFDFHRIDGEIEIEGVIYKYVKCRIYNDSLEMLCIPNTSKMKIQATKANFSKLAADFQQSNDTKKKSPFHSKSFQKVLSDYEAVGQVTYDKTYNTFTLNYATQNSNFVNTCFVKTAEQPPDFLLFNS